MRGWRYTVAFAGLLGGLVGGIYLAFRAIRSLEDGTTRTSVLARSDESGPARVDSTTAPRRGEPKPAPTPPASQSPSAHPVPKAPPRVAVAPSRPMPEPRQAALDTVWQLSRSGRDADALVILQRWLDRHLEDDSVRHEVARLKLRLGDRSGAWAEYERLIAAGTGERVEEEYAAALLANGRHAEAAARYDALLGRDGSRAEWRVAAARARIWDGRYREALGVLGMGRAQPGSELARLRRDARVALDLTPQEALAWISDDSTDAAAHLALARALARAGDPRQALSSYERAAASIPSTALLSEMAFVASEVPDSAAVASALGRAVALAPDDARLRRHYAEALVWAGDSDRAAAALDRLLAGAPSAELFELRGDLLRWKGDRRRARDDYRQALALDPASTRARAGLGQLARDLRRDVPWPAEEGTALAASGREDSDGFGSLVLRASHGSPIGFDRRTVVTAGIEYRRVARGPENAGSGRAMDGWGGDVGLYHRFEDVSLTGRLGGVSFSGRGETVTWRLGAEGGVGTVGWRASLERAPVYEALRSGRTLGLASAGSQDTTLAGTMGELSFTTSLGQRAEVWSRAGLLELGDGNRRTSIEASLRFSAAPFVNLVYGGGFSGFTDRSNLYWSPSLFTLHSLGLEYHREWPEGLMVAGRVLPGVSWSRELLPGGGTLARNAFQWQVGALAGFQRPRWDLGAEAGWGRDRGGLYSSWFWSLRMRYRW